MGARRDRVTEGQRRFARAWVRAHEERDPPAARVGAYRLRPAQAVAVGRILDAFDEFGGALLADPPGTGKTIVALAVAAAVGGTAGGLVVAPASLRAQWERSARRAGVPIAFVSMEALSRTARVERRPGAVVIVDEAHHARTARTKRHARLSALCAGARVLLLSATPVVNRITDREAMLSLFLPAASPAGTEGAALERCLIRREDVAAANPLVRRLPPMRLPPRDCHARIGELLGALPPPLPTTDGRAALALVRITLAMAWTSSLAALDAALRRRIQRGEALADLIGGGGTPTRAALREWIIGDDATQLAFPALVATPLGDQADAIDAAGVLTRHLDAVRALRRLTQPEVEPDARDRAALILAALQEDPHERLVVFARPAWTIRALWSALRNEPGVVAVIGERTFAAHGRWSRDEVLRALGPRARPLRGDDPRAIRLLLTTDLLAEGVELQGISRLIHADRAWTPATMEQREGRVARGTRREVTVARFTAPREAVPLLRLGQRLSHKDRARRVAVRRAACHEWADARIRRMLGRKRAGATDRPATTPATADAFLAALRWSGLADADHRIEFVAGEWRGGRWRIRASGCAIARVASRRPIDADPALLRSVRRALAKWLSRRAMRVLVGATGPDAPRATGAWRRLRRRVDERLRSTPHSARAGRAATMEAALAVLRAAGVAEVERGISGLLAVPPSDEDTFERSLVGLATRVARPTSPGARSSARLLALDARCGA